MKIFRRIKAWKHQWDILVKKQLRKVGIFKRLNLSFLLLLTASLFLTFFSFHQYSQEINRNLDRYSALLVQNVALKIQDTMKKYEDLALSFYDDPSMVRVLSENGHLLPEDTEFQKNTVLIENKLYSLGQNRKYIKNVQFVSPSYQYHMTEPNGFQRGATIRDLDEFYKSEFYLLPQEQKGYPVWMDSQKQTQFFYKNKQSVYGLPHIITMGIAVYEPASRDFLGVLLFNIDLNVFSGSIGSFEAYNDGNTFLIGQDGVLSWFSPSIQAPSYPKDPVLFAQMEKKGQDVIRLFEDGQKILLAYEKIPQTGLLVSYLADLDVVLAQAYHIRNLCIVVLICIVIACFILSYYVTISISEPIRQLIKVIGKTGGGTWNARYPNSGNDEITILGDCYNEMAEKISQLVDEVYISEIHRQQLQISWKNAQLDAMLMQINPHFLYNTLDIIRWEAMYEANGESPVTQMIEKFSTLCRMGMRTGSNTVCLKEGLQHASTYMDVINFRHNEKITLTFHTLIDADRYYIPQFMLQPLLENAVTHAFGGASKGYWIQITSQRVEETLQILIKDNGQGMSEEQLQELQAALSHAENPDQGIGLCNVHQRIRLFYGEPYGITIKSVQNQGTDITITLPLRDHSENMEINTEGATTYEIPGINR